VINDYDYDNNYIIIIIKNIILTFLLKEVMMNFLLQSSSSKLHLNILNGSYYIIIKMTYQVACNTNNMVSHIVNFYTLLLL
jgi:hypothetical protein